MIPALINFVTTNYILELEMDGYKTLKTQLEKEAKFGAIVVGLLLWWPELLWIYGPKAFYNYELRP